MSLQIVTFGVEEDLFKQARTIGILIDKPVQEILNEALCLWIDEWEEDNENNADYLS